MNGNDLAVLYPDHHDENYEEDLERARMTAEHWRDAKREETNHDIAAKGIAHAIKETLKAMGAKEIL
jgi:hypothetical protein